MNLPRVFFSRKGAFIAMTERNLTMLTDFYEFTMANGYFEKGMGNRRAYFDMFFRRVPDGGGYAIMAGVPARQKGEIDPVTGEYRWFKKD